MYRVVSHKSHDITSLRAWISQNHSYLWMLFSVCRSRVWSIVNIMNNTTNNLTSLISVHYTSLRSLLISHYARLRLSLQSPDHHRSTISLQHSPTPSDVYLDWTLHHTTTRVHLSQSLYIIYPKSLDYVQNDWHMWYTHLSKMIYSSDRSSSHINTSQYPTS